MIQLISIAGGMFSFVKKLVLAACTVLLFAGFANGATPLVAAGMAHTVALKADGTAVAWGDDSAGQLGQGTRLFTTQPLQVGGLPAATAASAGVGHVLILAQDGTVWAWGQNSFGQLGDGTRISRNAPVKVPGLNNVLQIAAGGGHSLALKADGTVWAWGQNTAGQVGDGTTINRPVPQQVQGLGTVTSISGGLSHSMALQNDGKVFAWGDNSLSEVDGLSVAQYLTPHGVGGLPTITGISASGTTSYAIAANGWVYWWGHMERNRPGQIPGITRILELTNIVSVSSGATASMHTMFVTDTGLVYMYYDHGEPAGSLLGQLPSVFAPVAGLTAGAVGALAGGDYADPNVRFVSPGGAFSAVLLSDGTINIWGVNTFGQVGVSSDQATAQPTLLTNVGNVVSLAAGDAFTVAVTGSGTVLVWGDNAYGELADGTRFNSSVPEPILGASGLTMIASGNSFSVALKQDGTVSAWGDNSLGQVGTGLLFATQSSPAPTGLAGMVAVAAGSRHALGLGSDGTVWSWGDNSSGQLGRTSTAAGIGGAYVGLLPAQVTNFSGGKAIAAGDGFSLALKSDGTVWNWGIDLVGQTGCVPFQGCGTDLSVPRQLGGMKNIVQIAAGTDFGLALRNDGVIFAFGSNTNGQLGSSFIVAATQTTPIQVTTVPPAASIAAGGRQGLAVIADGTFWTWGWNGSGQQGNGTLNDNAIPRLVLSTGPVASVSAGYQSAYAQAQSGVTYAWGDNSTGELGDGTFAARSTPIVVVRENEAGSVTTGDWFLNLGALASVTPPSVLVPSFLLQSNTVGADSAKAATTNIKYRPADAGISGSVFITAIIPQGTLPVLAGGSAVASSGPFEFVQLTPSGWQDIANLQLIPVASGTLGTGLATQTVVAGIDISQIPGAQFCIGYGKDSSAMVNNSTIRAVYTVPSGGSGSASCIPSSASVVPQAGVWWNPAQGGRGYTIEQRGTNLFMAAYLYDASGRSTWYGAGPAAMNGSVFTAPMIAYSGGQTLTGSYKIPTQGPSPGNITITFTDTTHGTMTWPGGTIPIQRYEFVTNGLNLPPTAAQPQTGWWWNPSEGGRGFSIEVQGNTAFIASYMYDGNGNPVWYASGPSALSSNNVFSADWLSFTGGQTLTGNYQSPTGSTPVGNLTIQFSSPTTGLLTLPNGNTINIQRFVF